MFPRKTDYSKYHANSLLVSLANNVKNENNLDVETTQILQWDRTPNMFLISGLYLYTNPPPMGYGSPGPKVAESVLRSYSFNLKQEEFRSDQIGNFTVENTTWVEERDGPFPFFEVTSNFSPGDAYKMFKKVLLDNHKEMDRIVEEVISDAMARNSDVLIRGRQTWDPLTERSLPSAQAYKAMSEFFQDNMGKSSTNCLEWIQLFMKSLSLEEIVTTQNVENVVYRKRYNRETRQTETLASTRKRLEKFTTTGFSVRKRIMEYARSFCSYIKHGERGKLKRRAIASANPILRMFLHIQEQFHLELGKSMPGSTISVGGEEKKTKIIQNLVTVNLETIRANLTMQSTQDATKWNECLNPGLFGLMHETFFNDEVRQSLGLPLTSKQGKLFLRIAIAGNFLLAIKRITLGDGPTATKGNHFNKLRWSPHLIPRMNTRTREWMERASKYISETGYMEASNGMLMGMHNAASTTLGLAATMYGTDESRGLYVTLRSSDDSMTAYAFPDTRSAGLVITEEYKALKLLGINLSVEKTWFFKEKYGEFTSWYQDGVFVAQYGVETSTIRPQGKNPHDDFHQLAKTTAVSQNRNEINPVGAQMKLIAGMDCIRRLYRISIDPEKRASVGHMVLLAADGGVIPWDCMSCHLEETSLREKWAVTNHDKEYLLRIRNVDNPFINDPSQEVTYSRDLGCMILSETETPRNVFTFVRKANRAIVNIKEKTHEANEKACSQLIEIMSLVDPSINVKAPSEKVKMSERIISYLDTESHYLGLGEEEKSVLKNTFDRLLTEKLSDDEKSIDEGVNEDDLSDSTLISVSSDEEL